jgi:hypothetical protein
VRVFLVDVRLRIVIISDHILPSAVSIGKRGRPIALSQSEFLVWVDERTRFAGRERCVDERVDARLMRID